VARQHGIEIDQALQVVGLLLPFARGDGCGWADGRRTAGEESPREVCEVCEPSLLVVVVVVVAAESPTESPRVLDHRVRLPFCVA
jgi:hypothetical protein